MANKDLELSIAIGGLLHPELGKSINQVQKALEALGLAGTETQEKLDAISKVDANQLALEKMYHLPVKEKILYFFHLDQAICL